MSVPLTPAEMLLRLGAAFVAGALVGLERERHGRAAGFRTTLLVCVAAALTMLISQILFVESASASPNWRPDPARLAAGLLAGMGFLGAGTIVRYANIVHGVTTAATLWFVTILGIAFGAGQFLVGTMGTAIAMAVLVLLRFIEKFLPVDWFVTLTILLGRLEPSNAEIRERLERLGLKVNRFEFDYDFVKEQRTITCDLQMMKSRRDEFSRRVTDELARIPGIMHVKWVNER